jgi:hypothetical protein
MISLFYRRVEPAFAELQQNVRVEQIQHPYERFSRGEDDKLFHSFKKRTEGLKRS